MVIHYGFENTGLKSPVVTLGIFDGVHLGHRALLGYVIEKARSNRGDSVVITFSPHPRLVIDPNTRDLFFLTTMEEKIALLDACGIDHLIVIEFNESFSRIRACDFVGEILVGKIGTRHLIVGHNHHFGRSGEGDYETLKKCTVSMDFLVERVPAFSNIEGVISSSGIRQDLREGNLDRANSRLGYHYQLTGTVVEGRKIGRLIGFPTANIKPSDAHKLIPGNGIYAVEVRLGSESYPGMLNIGTNPTVSSDSSARSIEVNILNFEGDIYGREISVVFIRRLRNEVKFASLEELAGQMELDRQEVLRLFSK